MKTRRTLAAVVATALAISLSACGTGGGSSGDELKIGYIGGASGFSAAFGVPTRDGVEAAVKAVNADGGVLGRKIKLVIADDKGDPTASQTAMRRLASDGVQLAISGSSSAASLAHQSVAAQNQVLVISPIGSDPAIIENQEGTPWYLVNVPSNTIFGATMAEQAKKSGTINSVAVFDRDDAYGNTITAGFVDKAKEVGLKVTGVRTYAIDKKDFGSDLISALGAEPDALFLSGYAEDSGLIAKQARAAGFTGTILGTSPMTSPQYIEVAGEKGANQSYISTASALLVQSNASEEQLEFVASWTKENGQAPNDYQLAAYDSLMAMVQAIEKADSTDAAKVRDALLKTEFTGVSGPVGFDDDGASRRPVYVVEYLDGMWQEPKY